MEYEDDVPTSSDEATLFDLAKGGEVLADLLYADTVGDTRDTVVSDVHTQAELLLCNIKLRAKALSRIPAGRDTQITEAREAVAGKISDLMALCSALGYLQGVGLAEEEEEAISTYAEQWDDYIRASPDLTCAVMMESLCSMMLDFVDAQSPDEDDEIMETLESAHVSIVAGCMLLCSQLNLDYDAVLYNASRVSYVGQEDFNALVKSFNKKGF